MDVPTALDISRTNGLFRPQDCAALDALAKRSQEELALLRQKVKDTRKQFALLESKVAETERCLSVCQSLSTPSPIRRLPPELLALVFTYACKGDKLHVMQLYEPLPTCVTLVRVCKYWRDLAFGTKAIWEHFIILQQDTFDLDPGEGIVMLGGIVDLYRNRLTHLYVDCQYCADLNDELLDVMFSLQDQLVSLALVDGDCIYGYMDTFEMPMLEELFLLCQFGDYGARNKPAFVKFNAPKLKRVFLHCPEEEFTTDNPSLPWHQINHLSVGSPCTQGDVYIICAEDLFSLLTQTPALASLHLTCLFFKQEHGDEEPWPARAQPIITHQQLKYLELFDSHLELLVPSFPDDICLLPCISTPSLENLDLFFSIHPRKSEWHQPLHDALVPFFQRTPSLRHIRLVLVHSMGRQGLSHNSPASSLQFTGKTTCFAMLSRIITEDEGDNSFTELGKKRAAPMEGWLSQHDIWTDRLIDRYINQFPVDPSSIARDSLNPTGEHSREGSEQDTLDSGDKEGYRGRRGAGEHVEERHYNAKDRRTMKAVFALLGDERIPSHIQRHVYLAF